MTAAVRTVAWSRPRCALGMPFLAISYLRHSQAGVTAGRGRCRVPGLGPRQFVLGLIRARPAFHLVVPDRAPVAGAVILLRAVRPSGSGVSP
jgi:hypothetical protein